MGNKIILIGDYKGQFLPVYDRWGDSADIATSNLLHTLCNGLHINLTVYRRGTDPELFAFYHDKLYHTDFEADLQECVQEARARYPCDACRLPDVALTISHKKRAVVNRLPTRTM